jgi:hypothetical protein
MQILEISAGAMLLFGGLWSGSVFAVAVEWLVLSLRLPPSERSSNYPRQELRLGPLLTILGLCAVAAAAVFAFHSSGDAKRDAIAGIAGFALVVMASISFAASIRTQFRHGPGEIPAKANQYWHFWRGLHLVRTVLSLLTFGCFVAAVLQFVRW